MERSSPSKIARDLADHFVDAVNPKYEDRVALLRKTTGVRDEDIVEYEKTEILRRAREQVQRIATKNQITRLSPTRLYSGVKSKVAANLQSQRKAMASRPTPTTLGVTS